MRHTACYIWPQKAKGSLYDEFYFAKKQKQKRAENV